jgi:hypothetical protein
MANIEPEGLDFYRNQVALGDLNEETRRQLAEMNPSVVSAARRTAFTWGEGRTQAEARFDEVVGIYNLSDVALNSLLATANSMRNGEA